MVFLEKWLFADAARANVARKVTFRKKWLFEKVAFLEKRLFADAARANVARQLTFRKKWLFDKSGFSRKVAFRRRCAPPRREKSHFVFFKEKLRFPEQLSRDVRVVENAARPNAVRKLF